MKKLSLLLMLGLLISCAEQDIDQIYQGRYHWGPEVNSFTPCNSENSYWVSYNWAGMEMSNYYKENATAAYQPMYLEFRGHLLNEKRSEERRVGKECRSRGSQEHEKKKRVM